MKKVIALLLALSMVLALCACGGSEATSAPVESAATEVAASDDVINVSIQLTFPEESASGAKEVLAAIEEASGGRIKFEIYYSFSFVESADVPEALKTNQLDIAGMNLAEYPATFPLNGAMCSLPLLNYPGWEAANQIYLNTLYNNADMMAEFTNNGMVFWAGYMMPGYQLYSTQEITDLTPSAFNGKTVMCDNAQMQELINQNKGGSSTVIPTDFLTNLQNGVADTLMQHVCCAYVFGCFDYVKSAVFFGDGGFYNLPLGYAFSETFWNSLPEDLQSIFAEYADDLCYKSYTSDVGLYDNVAYPTLAEKATITVLDEAQIAVWQEAMQPIVDSAVENIKQDSPNVDTALQQLKENIASYNAETFKIGTNNFGVEAQWG